MRFGRRERIAKFPAGQFLKRERWKTLSPDCILTIAIEFDRHSKTRSTAARISPASFASCFVTVVCVGRQPVDEASRRLTARIYASAEFQWMLRRKKTWIICSV